MSSEGLSNPTAFNVGPATKTSSKNFSLTNYKRLEASNNYVNLLSAILLLVALGMIPVIYFSLDAARSDDTTTNISGTIQGQRWQYNLQLAPILKEHSKKTKLKFELHVSREVNAVGPTALKEYPKTVTIPLHPTITNVTITILEEGSDSSGVLCDEDKLNFCMFIREFQIVENTLKYGKGIRVWIQTPEGTLKEDYPINWGRIATDFKIQEPSFNLKTIDFCDNLYCNLGWTCTSTEEPLGNLKEVACNPHSSKWSNVIFDGNLGIDVQPYVQLATVGQTENLLITQTLTFFRFINSPKYSTTDTLIDSFAISGLVIGIVVLSVILLKLAIYAIFNPAKRV